MTGGGQLLPACAAAAVVAAAVATGALRPPVRRPSGRSRERPWPAGVAGRVGALIRRVTGLGAATGDVARGRVAVVAVGLMWLSPLLALALPPVAVAVGRQRSRRTTEAAAAAAWRELPEAAELLAVAVAAGCNPLGAVRVVGDRLPGPVGGAFREAVDLVAAGSRLDEALGIAARPLGAVAAPLLDALRAAERYGTPLLPGLRRCADELRVARRRRIEEGARRVPVRLLGPLCGCILPAFVLLTFVPLLAGGLAGLDPAGG